MLPARDVAASSRSSSAPDSLRERLAARLKGQGCGCWDKVQPRAVALSPGRSAATCVDQSDPGWEITSPIVPFTTTRVSTVTPGASVAATEQYFVECERDGALRVLDLDPRAVDA